MTGNTASFILPDRDWQNVDGRFLAELHTLALKAKAEFRKDKAAERPNLHKLERTLATMVTDPNWGRLYADFWQGHKQAQVKACVLALSDRVHNLAMAPLNYQLGYCLLDDVIAHTKAAWNLATAPTHHAA